MKKTYIIPTLTVVEIKPNHLMLPASGSTDEESGNLGRRATFSDWEEEADYDK